MWNKFWYKFEYYRNPKMGGRAGEQSFRKQRLFNIIIITIVIIGIIILYNK